MRTVSVLVIIVLVFSLDGLEGLLLAQEVDECTQSEPHWVFCSGFEEGSLDIWDDYDGNPPSTNTLLVDAGPFGRVGNHVMRLRVPAGTGGADLVKVLPSTHVRLYARWYVRWETGYDFLAPNHGSGLHAGARDLLARSGYRPNGEDRFNAYADVSTWNRSSVIYSYYRGMYQDCADPEGACWGDHFPCTIDDGQVYCTDPAHRETTPLPMLQTSRWYCVEIMLNGGTPTADPDIADGSLNIWIDGVGYGPWTNLWMRTTPDLRITILWLNLYFHAEHSTAGILIDNVVVSTEPIGPAGDMTGIEDQNGAASWGSVKAGFR
jgi:hypothetical protein